MPMTREQWEDWAVRKHGSLQQARQHMSNIGSSGGTTTKARGHLDKIGFQNMDRETHLVYAAEGGRRRKSNEGEN